MREFLQYRRLLISCMLGLLFLTGCATTNKVTQDFKPDTDFKSFKTFSWHNFSSEIPESNKGAIQSTIEQALTQQGFVLVNDKPDLLLDINIIKQRSSSGSSTGLGFSIGLPVGSHGGIGLGTSTLLGKDNKLQGLIILDITSQQTNQVLWRGTAEAIPMTNFLLRNERQLNVVLKNLVAQFPPK
jgi:hypothetical protein